MMQRTRPSDLVVSVDLITRDASVILSQRSDIPVANNKNRICQNLNVELAGKQSRIPAWLITNIMEVADNSLPLLEGRSPASVAAGAVLFVLSYTPDKRGKWTASDVAKVIEGSLRQKFAEHL